MAHKFTNEILTAAIEGYEAQKRRLDEQIAELRTMLAPGPAKTAATPEIAPRKRKRFSAASRRKMALAQQARWAKIKGESVPAAPKPKRKFSPAEIKAIREAARRRWAEVKAEATKAVKKATKKAAKKSAPTKKAAKKTAPAVASS